MGLPFFGRVPDTKEYGILGSRSPLGREISKSCNSPCEGVQKSGPFLIFGGRWKLPYTILLVGGRFPPSTASCYTYSAYRLPCSFPGGTCPCFRFSLSTIFRYSGEPCSLAVRIAIEHGSPVAAVVRSRWGIRRRARVRTMISKA